MQTAACVAGNRAWQASIGTTSFSLASGRPSMHCWTALDPHQEGAPNNG
jgi:hypothetical protein